MASIGPTPGTPQDQIQDLINRKLNAKLGSTPSPQFQRPFPTSKKTKHNFMMSPSATSSAHQSPGPSEKDAQPMGSMMPASTMGTTTIPTTPTTITNCNPTERNQIIKSSPVTSRGASPIDRTKSHPHSFVLKPSTSIRAAGYPSISGSNVGSDLIVTKKNDSRANSPSSRSLSPSGRPGADSPIFYKNSKPSSRLTDSRPSSRSSDFSGYTVERQNVEKVTFAGITYTRKNTPGNSDGKSGKSKKSPAKADSKKGKTKEACQEKSKSPQTDEGGKKTNGEKAIGSPSGTKGKETAERLVVGVGVRETGVSGSGGVVGQGGNVLQKNANVVNGQNGHAEVGGNLGTLEPLDLSIGGGKSSTGGKEAPNGGSLERDYTNANGKTNGHKEVGGTQIVGHSNKVSTNKKTQKETPMKSLPPSEETVRQIDVLDDIASVPPMPVSRRKKKKSPSKSVATTTTTVMNGAATTTTVMNSATSTTTVTNGATMTTAASTNAETSVIAPGVNLAGPTTSNQQAPTTSDHLSTTSIQSTPTSTRHLSTSNQHLSNSNQHSSTSIQHLSTLVHNLPTTGILSPMVASDKFSGGGRGRGRGKGKGGAGTAVKSSAKTNSNHAAAILRSTNFGRRGGLGDNLKSEVNGRNGTAKNIIDLDELMPDELKRERSQSSLSTAYGVAPGNAHVHNNAHDNVHNNAHDNVHNNAHDHVHDNVHIIGLANLGTNRSTDSIPTDGEPKVEVKVDLDEDDFFESLFDGTGESAPHPLPRPPPSVGTFGETNSTSVTALESEFDSLFVDPGPIISDPIKASISTYRFAEESHCPMCWEKGIGANLSFRFISLEEGVWLCSTDGCPFPIGLETELFSFTHDLEKLGPEIRKQ